MRALSLRQPYAELILRGIETVEYRGQPTSVIGEPFYSYASDQWAAEKLFVVCVQPNAGTQSVVWPHDLGMPGADGTAAGFRPRF